MNQSTESLSTGKLEKSKRFSSLRKMITSWKQIFLGDAIPSERQHLKTELVIANLLFGPKSTPSPDNSNSPKPKEALANKERREDLQYLESLGRYFYEQYIARTFDVEVINPDDPSNLIGTAFLPFNSDSTFGDWTTSSEIDDNPPLISNSEDQNYLMADIRTSVDRDNLQFDINAKMSPGENYSYFCFRVNLNLIINQVRELQASQLDVICIPNDLSGAEAAHIEGFDVYRSWWEEQKRDNPQLQDIPFIPVLVAVNRENSGGKLWQALGCEGIIPHRNPGTLDNSQNFYTDAGRFYLDLLMTKSSINIENLPFNQIGLFYDPGHNSLEKRSDRHLWITTDWTNLPADGNRITIGMHPNVPTGVIGMFFNNTIVTTLINNEAANQFIQNNGFTRIDVITVPLNEIQTFGHVEGLTEYAAAYLQTVQSSYDLNAYSNIQEYGKIPVLVGIRPNEASTNAPVFVAFTPEIFEVEHNPIQPSPIQ